ncbi:hypothetical protein [Oceanisphaera sp.]|uniref:hypothetical protein n=1 Tax=Oceanisphaera sp. TaxID=1929979 RepID=UPI003A8E7AE3
MKVTTITAHYTAATVLLLSLNVMAAAHHQDVSTIAPGTINDVSGVIGINMAAGDNNAQANLRSITIGENAQAAHRSRMTVTASPDDSAASASIAANTLNNARGLISVNQVAGSGNIQLNDIAIALGASTQISSDSLLMVRLPEAGASTDEDKLASNKTVYLDTNSLNGAAGAIQINQIAGHGNIAINRVSMPLN